jgi:hypothetical protein
MKFRRHSEEHGNFRLIQKTYLAHRAFTAAAILALDAGLMFRFFATGLSATVPYDARYFAHRAFAASIIMPEYYYAPTSSLIETQKTNPCWPRPTEPRPFSNRR